MSRSILYSVTFKNNVKKCVVGLHNPVNAECFTSHFNGIEKEKMIQAMLEFEKTNTKAIKRREYYLNARTGSTSDNWLDATIQTQKPIFPEFRQIFDGVFEEVNSFKD